MNANVATNAKRTPIQYTSERSTPFIRLSIYSLRNFHLQHIIPYICGYGKSIVKFFGDSGILIFYSARFRDFIPQDFAISFRKIYRCLSQAKNSTYGYRKIFEYITRKAPPKRGFSLKRKKLAKRSVLRTAMRVSRSGSFARRIKIGKYGLFGREAATQTRRSRARNADGTKNAFFS